MADSGEGRPAAPATCEVDVADEGTASTLTVSEGTSGAELVDPGLELGDSNNVAEKQQEDKFQRKTKHEVSTKEKHEVPREPKEQSGSTRA